LTIEFPSLYLNLIVGKANITLIGFQVEISEKYNLTLKDYFGDQRIYVVSGINKIVGTNVSQEVVLQMHGGLWWVCYDLTGNLAILVPK